MMFVSDVEQIMDAFEGLLAGVSDVAPFTGPIPTVTRVWIPWNNLAETAQPGIVITEPQEEQSDRRGQQPSLKLLVRLVCYIRVDKRDLANPPSTRVNTFLKAIRTALLPKGSDLVRNAQTLGGLVSNVYIDGKILKDAGVIDDQGSMLVPVTILIS